MGHAFEDGLEKDVQKGLEQGLAIVVTIQNKLQTGASVSEEISQLKISAENIRISNLLMEERFKLREEKVKPLGTKALERQQAMAEGYRVALTEYLEIIESLPSNGQPSAISDQQTIINKLKKILDRIVSKKKRPIIGSVPYKHLNYPAVEPSAAPAITPAYKGENKTVSPDDTKDTPEAPISKEIAALAQTLGWSPVSIYEYVKNNIQTEWYWGCMKGAEETLHQKSGNDCDQATLLTALLRASGYPTRYVRGSVEFITSGNEKPIDRIRNLFGIDDPANIARFLQKAGVPFKPVIAAGGIANFRIEHLWVESQIPYANYRGAIIDNHGKTWLGLDTSIKVKGYQQNQPKDVYELSAISGQLSQVRDQYLGIASSGTGSTPFELNQTPLEYLQSSINSELGTLNSELRYADLLRSRVLLPEIMNILPAGLQFKEITITNEYTSIPDDLKHKVRFTAKTTQNSELLNYELDAFRLSNQQITITYEPETVQDQETINAWGGLDNTPAYLVRLRSVLKVGDQRAVVGRDGLPMGSDYELTIELVSPNGTEKTTNSLIVGNLTVIGITAQKAVIAPSPLAGEGGGEGKKDAERLLYEAANHYIDRWNKSEEELASLLHLAIARPIPTVVTLGGVIDVTYLLDMPHGFTWKGVYLDADLRRIETVQSAQYGVQSEREKLFMQLSGLQGSILENRIFEDDFQVESISTAKLIQLCTANSALCTGMITIDKNNIETILPTLSVDDNIKEDMVNAVNQGYELRTVNSELAYHDWSGIGYITEKPETGESGWMLSGMIAGGMTVKEEWLNQHYRDTLSAPYTGPFNPDALSAAGIQKVTATEGQEDGTVGTELAEPIAVFVFDAKKQPVKEASVTFTVTAGGGSIRCENPAGGFGPPVTPSCTTKTRGMTGIARARVVLGESTGSNPDYKLYPGDANYTQVGLNIVTASARAYTSDIPLARPFFLHAKPGGLAKIIKVYPTEPVMGLANNPAGTLHSRATDSLDNPISNIVLTYKVDKVESLDTRYMPLPATYNKMGLYEQETCGNPYPVYGDCPLYTSLTVTTSTSGAKVSTILGNTLGTLYTVKVSAPDMYSGVSPVYYDLLTLGRRDGPAKIVAPLLLVQALETVNERGEPINAAKAGTQLAAPLQARLILIEDEIDAVQQICTKNDQDGNPVSYTGYNLVSRGTVTVRPIPDGTVTFTSTSGVGQTGEVQNVHNGYYLASYTTITDPAVNTVEVNGSAEVTVRMITARDNIISYVPYDRCLEASEVGNIQITLKHGQHAVLDPFTHALLPEKTLLSKPTYTIYGVGTTLTVEPPVVLVDEDGYAAHDTTLTYTILPPAYNAVSMTLDTFKVDQNDNETWTGMTLGDKTQGSGQIIYVRGAKFDPRALYLEQVVLNRGMAAEIRGEKKELTVMSIIVHDDDNKLAKEIKFGRGDRSDKRYHIDIPTSLGSANCASHTGMISVVDKNGEVIIPPTVDGEIYAAKYNLAFQPFGSMCVVNVSDILNNNVSKQKFIVSNLSRAVLDVGFPLLNIYNTAVLYGGIGNRIRIEIDGLRQEIPVEPVGVVILGIDGLRQDVLYPDMMDGLPFENVHEPVADYYVDASTLSGFGQILVGDPHVSAKQKYVMLPEVTTIFPSITFAAWASIFTGKTPNETGILGNEFFARDIYQKHCGPGMLCYNKLPGLWSLPAGMVTLDADGGAFRPLVENPFTASEEAKSLPFILNYVMPAEFSIFSNMGHELLSQKNFLSTANAALSTTAKPLWEDINAMVSKQYKTSPIQGAKCSASKYECRTVTMFNQYARSADWWGTPASLSDEMKILVTSYFPQFSLNTSKVMDKSARQEAVGFINSYFSQPTTDGKRKRFPAVFSIYLSGLDHEAHINGLAGYKNYFTGTVNDQVQDIVKALKDQGEFDNKMFIIVSDHGETQMPMELTYEKTQEAFTYDGSPLPFPEVVGVPIDMSCNLKTNIDNEDVQLSELANNNLHIWELANLFAQFPDPNISVKVLVPEQIAKLPKLDAVATSNINQANIVATLNGPMAHVYVKGTTWQSNPDEPTIDSVLVRLYSILKIGNAATGKLAEKITEHFLRLGSSIDTILARWTLNGSYEVITGVSEDASGNVTISTDDLDSLNNTGYQRAVDRITNMNHKDRSGDIILLMKDSTAGNATDRYSTAYACKSWHGSLNASDSYVPFVVAYPGGNKSELDPYLSIVCPSNTCEGNWKLTDLIKEITKKQYAGQ